MNWLEILLIPYGIISLVVGVIVFLKSIGEVIGSTIYSLFEKVSLVIIVLVSSASLGLVWPVFLLVGFSQQISERE